MSVKSLIYVVFLLVAQAMEICTYGSFFFLAIKKYWQLKVAMLPFLLILPYLVLVYIECIKLKKNDLLTLIYFYLLQLIAFLKQAALKNMLCTAKQSDNSA